MKTLFKNYLPILLDNFPIYVFGSGLIAPVSLLFAQSPSEWFVSNLISCCILSPMLSLIFNPPQQKDDDIE